MPAGFPGFFEFTLAFFQKLAGRFLHFSADVLGGAPDSSQLSPNLRAQLLVGKNVATPDSQADAAQYDETKGLIRDSLHEYASLAPIILISFRAANIDSALTPTGSPPPAVWWTLRFPDSLSFVRTTPRSRPNPAEGSRLSAKFRRTSLLTATTKESPRSSWHRSPLSWCVPPDRLQLRLRRPT